MYIFLRIKKNVIHYNIAEKEIILFFGYMNRKKFIWFAVVAAAGAAVPVLINNIRKKRLLSRPFAYPSFLACFMNESTIRKIGIACRLMKLTENSKAKLEQVLDAAIAKRNPSGKTDSQLTDELEKETIYNFQTNKTIIADGWVLSITEARQCALFSLTQ